MESKLATKNKYVNLLKETNYMKEAIASAISRFGDGIDAIAFSWLVYEITGSTLLVATLYAVNGIPNILFGLFSGVICNYLSERKIMYICDLGRGLCVTMISILYITGKIEVWHLYVITFLNSSFEAFRSPVVTSIVPKIISEENMENGLALSSSMNRITEMLGLVVAPIIISICDLGWTIVIDAVTFFICAVLVMSMKLKEEKLDKNMLTIKSGLKDLVEGFKYITKDKFILNLCIFACVINALVVPFNSLQAPYVDLVLNKGSEAISVMSSSMTLAMAVGMIFIPKLKKFIGGGRMFIIGGVIMGVMYSGLSLLGGISDTIMYICLGLDTALMGIGAILLNFPLQVSMLKRTPDEYLGRVASLFNALALCAVPITSSLIGLLSNMFKVGTLYMILGIFTVIVFLLQILNKYIKEFNKY